MSVNRSDALRLGLKNALARLLPFALPLGLLALAPARAADLDAATVRRAIDRGVRFLESQQAADGSWSGIGPGAFKTGVTALSTLALIESGGSTTEGPAAAGLGYLRKLREPNPDMTYDLGLTIMALAAAKDPRRDGPRLVALADRLERSGGNSGTWDYTSDGTSKGSYDHSNSQYAVLGLRAAAFAGVEIDRATWRAIRDHWVGTQGGDGSWSYKGTGGNGTGSMTVAGIATLAAVRRFLRDDELGPTGAPICCHTGEDRELADALARGETWLARNFSVSTNPRGGAWLLYYLYGLERGGRFSGKRFFGPHDWYREGARFLVDNQVVRDGSWRGIGLEQDAVVGTALSLLFLSKGLAPVLINKLGSGEADPGEGWNVHPDDARNLTEYVSGLPDWPRLVTWQMLDLDKAAESGSVGDLLQAPVLYIIDEDLPFFEGRRLELLREYIDAGGFVFTVAACGDARFGRDVERLVRRMYPDEGIELRPLDAGHPVYRSEYLLDPAAAPLEGIDIGCRTALIHSPDDLACLWDRWLPVDYSDRDPRLLSQVTQKLRVGVNVLAYATGREPPAKLDVDVTPEADDADDPVERGLWQVAKLKHGGNWDAAPRAVRNLMKALNRKAGTIASTKKYAIAPTDPDLFQYPLVYMHGLGDFSPGEEDVEAIKTYLERGGVLIADACCGSPAFDRSFRDFVAGLGLGDLKNLPPEHPLLTASFGHDLSKVSRRSVAGGADAVIDAAVTVAPAALEAVADDEGRLKIIYSRYDLSCALEKQSSAACAGYLPEDAVKIAINLVLYASLQAE